ncbi:hypothetical protein BDP27DRAFT_1317719 [Rhodocollybia butyracea]|uniref:Glutamate--tRNA ligase, mitochondrial n=1 Tax=Rhodocollybia butyracea TaxID=206335 RepID=A0A9P5Q366_9AGAR|nr:hypothetical protein BDP27DRAFT_1317719 [Rhodocollybia butyracea]
MVLLRFAPSPTGPLHLGGLRMALYNHLYARRLGGKWILRIEDTDATRFVPGSVEGIRKALDWAGLDYDYGPERDGSHGPYFQSERRDLYRQYASKLIDNGNAYRCFCSVDQLTEVKARLARSGSNSTYDKKCLYLSDEEVARKVKAGEKFVVRVNDDLTPTRATTHDLIFGYVRDAHLSLATDPVLLKSDQFPTYHLASVVDDHEMGITHVLRGEEWLPSLPLHLDLYTHLNLSPPQFAHVPILLNADKTKMSKRNGDVQVVDYIHRGWEPQAILNWLALSSWGAKHLDPPLPSDTEPGSKSSRPPSPIHLEDAPDSTQLMTLEEMISDFDITAITHRSSVLDVNKLEFINKHHLMNTWSKPDGLDELAQRVHGFVKQTFPSRLVACPYTTIDGIKTAITLLEGRLTNIHDIPQHAPYLFIEPDLTTDEAKHMISGIPTDQRLHVLNALETLIKSNGCILKSLRSERQKLGINQKTFMTVLRYALSGMKDGPAVVDTVRALGNERVLARLAAARGEDVAT